MLRNWPKPPASSFIVLRVTTPRVPSVGVFIARLQADQQTVDCAGVNGAFRERGLERHRLFQRVGEGHPAVLLFDREEMALPAAQVKVALAERGRRKDLCVFADSFALDFGAPGEFPIAGLD